MDLGIMDLDFGTHEMEIDVLANQEVNFVLALTNEDGTPEAVLDADWGFPMGTDFIESIPMTLKDGFLNIPTPLLMKTILGLVALPITIESSVV